MKDFFKKLFSINPALPLHKNHSFWLAIAAPAFVAILLLAGSTQNTGGICFSSDCQNHFLESNKLPLGVLSLSVLLGVMVGRFHGSAQRIASHKQADENNTFRNFYDHRKLFTEWMSESQNRKINEFKYISIHNSATLYHALFNLNSPTRLSTELSATHVKSCFIQIIEDMKNNLNHFGICHSDQMQQPPPETSLQLLEQLVNFSNVTCSKFGIEITPPANWVENYQKSEMVIIAEEITIALTHAFRFSSHTAAIELPLPDGFIRLTENENVEEGLSRAITFNE